MCYLRSLPLLAALLLLGACAGSGAGLDSSGQPQGAGGPAAGVLTADFGSIQQHVLTPICTVCHAGAAAPQGLRLDSTNSYALLVGIPSTEVSSVLRVRAGDPANSYLIEKLEGHAAVGVQMPFGGPPLPAATIAVIRQWITDGAQRASTTSTSSSASGFAMTAVAPDNGTMVSEAPARLVMEFSDELDQTRIDASSVRLEAVPADGGGNAQARLVPVQLSVATGNARALIVAPLEPLADGRYRLVVSGTPATGLSAVSGQRFQDAAGVQFADTIVSEFVVAGPR